MIRNKFLNKFIPIFLSLYCLISLLPKLDFLKMDAAFFPISCFDLYSIVPNEFLDYDLLIDKGSETEHFLYLNNKSLNEIEAKFYRSWIRKIGIHYEYTCEINIEEINRVLGSKMLEGMQSIHLVSLKGHYTELIRDDNYELNLLKKIK